MIYLLLGSFTVWSNSFVGLFCFFVLLFARYLVCFFLLIIFFFIFFLWYYSHCFCLLFVCLFLLLPLLFSSCYSLFSASSLSSSTLKHKKEETETTPKKENKERTKEKKERKRKGNSKARKDFWGRLFFFVSAVSLKASPPKGAKNTTQWWFIASLFIFVGCWDFSC